MKRHLIVSGVLGLALVFAAPRVQAQEVAAEPATHSKLTGIRLQQAQRITDKNFTHSLQDQLRDVLKEASKGLGWQAQLVAPEVLGWELSRANAGTAVTAVSQSLSTSGFTVKLDDLGEHDGSNLKLLTATRPNQGQVAIGVWIISDSATFLAWGFAAPSDNTGGEVLVEGTPPLTEGTVRRYTDFLVWLFDKPELVRAKDQLQQLTAVYLADLWKRNAATAMAGTFNVLRGYEQRNTLSKTEREGARQWLLHGLREAAYDGEKDDIAGETVMKVYEMVDPTVAAGKAGAPPLTKSGRDDYVQLVAFALEHIQDGVQMTAEEKDALGDWFVSAFPTWSVADQNNAAQVSLAWQTLHDSWPTMPASQQTELQAKWSQSFGALADGLRTNRAKLLQAKREAEQSKFQAQQAQQTSGSKSEAYRKAMESARSSWRSYQTLSNAMWQSHYTRMNGLLSWGGSSYRYVNQWGNPY